MKFLNILKNNQKTTLLLSLFVLLSLLLHIYKIDQPSLNSDEAAHGYNAYSIIKTGRDEYGTLLPLRFKSFGEYKSPVLTYLIAPFVGLFGLNDITVRMPTLLIGILSPILFFLLGYELFRNKKIALLAAFLAAVTPWIQLISRHAHEAVVGYLCIALALLFFLRFLRTHQQKELVFFSIANLLALFSYHSSKVFVVFFFLLVLVTLWQHRGKSLQWKGILLAIFILPVIFFTATEFMYPTSRISNLLFYKRSGFVAAIEESRREHNVQFIHNKLTKSITQLTNQYISYFSPEFLVIKGDNNIRFGFPQISPITILEYIGLFLGLYFLFKNQATYRYLLVGMLLFAPLSASISWTEYSLTRTFYLIIPLLLIVAYGLYHFIQAIPRYRYALVGIITLAYLFFSFMSWEFYFHHYFKKPEVLESWQAGYKEVGAFIKDNYDTYDKFYITKKAGQPYIFTLFYLQYPPEKYQSQAQLTALDEYGFGQIEKFDKFEFDFQYPLPPNTVLIGKPEEFNGLSLNEGQLHKIKVNEQDMFYIYESKTENAYALK